MQVQQFQQLFEEIECLAAETGKTLVLEAECEVESAASAASALDLPKQCY